MVVAVQNSSKTQIIKIFPNDTHFSCPFVLELSMQYVCDTNLLCSMQMLEFKINFGRISLL